MPDGISCRAAELGCSMQSVSRGNCLDSSYCLPLRGLTRAALAENLPLAQECREAAQNFPTAPTVFRSNAVHGSSQHSWAGAATSTPKRCAVSQNQTAADRYRSDQTLDTTDLMFWETRPQIANQSIDPWRGVTGRSERPRLGRISTGIGCMEPGFSLITCCGCCGRCTESSPGFCCCWEAAPGCPAAPVLSEGCGSRMAVSACQHAEPQALNIEPGTWPSCAALGAVCPR